MYTQFLVYMPTTVTQKACISLIVQCLKGLERGSEVAFRVCKKQDSSFDLYLSHTSTASGDENGNHIEQESATPSEETSCTELSLATTTAEDCHQS